MYTNHREIKEIYTTGMIVITCISVLVPVFCNELVYSEHIIKQCMLTGLEKHAWCILVT